MWKRWMPGLCLGLVVSASAWSADARPLMDSASLSASAMAEVVQDRAALVVFVQREGSDAAAVQAQLSKVLTPALNQARAAAGRDVEVGTGAFSVWPRYGNDGRIQQWEGRAELLLSGRDIGVLSSLAGQLKGMALAQVRWSVSPALRQRIEDEVQAQAVERFRAKAQALARQFGYNSYQLQQVQVSGDDPGGPIRPVFAARAMAANAAPPVPLEAGTASVGITVQGTVQFKP